MLTATLAASCATTGSRGVPVEDPGGIASSARAANALETPMRVVFGWSLNEPGLRAQGRGVARLEPPDRARLDLFAGSGETVAAAALVGGEMRLPTGSPEIIPAPSLLWAAMGIFDPGDGATLLGGEVERGGEVHHLRYRLRDGTELHYRLRAGRVDGAELHQGGHAVERVSLAGTSEGPVPREATYRNLGAFRELRVTLESFEHVEGFPSRIWAPGR